MAEKVKKLNLEPDYKQYLYFIDGEGNVCRKPKSGEGESKVMVEHAVNRDNQYLYFIDKEGDISARSAAPAAATRKQREGARVAKAPAGAIRACILGAPTFRPELWVQR